MAAYWVARSKINDPVEYKKYTDRVPAIISRYGGKVLARGGRYQILEGPQKFQRFVVIEFPSLEQAVARHPAPEVVGGAADRIEAHLREALAHFRCLHHARDLFLQPSDHRRRRLRRREKGGP